MIELNNGESNFILEVKEETKQKPKLLNQNYYLISNDITYFSNIFDNYNNSILYLDVLTSNNTYYLSGFGTDYINYNNVKASNISIPIEKSTILEINVNSYGNHPFVIVQSATNPIRLTSDSNRYINSNLSYKGDYEIGYGLIDGKVLWDTSSSDVGKYYCISLYDVKTFFIIEITNIIDRPIKYLSETNTLQVNNNISEDNFNFKILANNAYGTTIATIKLVKSTISNNILTENIINITIDSLETKIINLFSYKYANYYNIVNNPDITNIILIRNILSIQNSNKGIYELLIEMDDYLFVFKITEN